MLALFPVLLLLLAGFGVVLQAVSPAAELQLQSTIARALPGTTGTMFVQAATAHLKASVCALLAVGLVAAFIAGSRLFVTLENCFGIIFRLPGRDPLRQNRVAVGMLALNLVVVPVVFLVSILPANLITWANPRWDGIFSKLVSDGARLVIWFAGALLFFAVTYIFVPYRSRHWRTWRKNWVGTVTAAVLLVVYEGLFRVYERYLLRASNDGSVAAFAIVILVFLYYCSDTYGAHAASDRPNSTVQTMSPPYMA